MPNQDGEEISVYSTGIFSSYNMIVTAGGDGHIKLWKYNSTSTPAYQLLYDKDCKQDILYKVLVSPDEKFLLTYGKDKTIRSWKISYSSLTGKVSLASTGGLDLSKVDPHIDKLLFKFDWNGNNLEVTSLLLDTRRRKYLASIVKYPNIATFEKPNKTTVDLPGVDSIKDIEYSDSESELFFIDTESKLHAWKTSLYSTIKDMNIADLPYMPVQISTNPLNFNNTTDQYLVLDDLGKVHSYESELVENGVGRIQNIKANNTKILSDEESQENKILLDSNSGARLELWNTSDKSRPWEFIDLPFNIKKSKHFASSMAVSRDQKNVVLASEKQVTLYRVGSIQSAGEYSFLSDNIDGLEDFNVSPAGRYIAVISSSKRKTIKSLKIFDSLKDNSKGATFSPIANEAIEDSVKGLSHIDFINEKIIIISSTAEGRLHFFDLSGKEISAFSTGLDDGIYLSKVFTVSDVKGKPVILITASSEEGLIRAWKYSSDKPKLITEIDVRNTNIRIEDYDIDIQGSQLNLVGSLGNDSGILLKLPLGSHQDLVNRACYWLNEHYEVNQDKRNNCS